MPLHPVRPGRVLFNDSGSRGTLLGEIRRRAGARVHIDTFANSDGGGRIEGDFLAYLARDVAI